MNRREATRLAFAAFVVVSAIVVSCVRERPKRKRSADVSSPKDPSLMLVTGYCNCGDCCGWRRNWFGFGGPVYASGPLKGKPKRVGVTASGTTAKRGTIAADAKSFPLGARLVVPGYGTGVVEDVGGAIRGKHLDVWFPSHAEAMRWGRRWLKVECIAGAQASTNATANCLPPADANRATSSVLRVSVLQTGRESGKIR